MPQPLTIWCSAKFPLATMNRLRATVGAHRLVQAAASSANNLDAGKPDPQLESAQIALSQPNPQQIIRSPQLRYVQLTTAGYTRYDTREFRGAMARSGT